MYRLKILFEFAMKPVYFLNSEFTVIYTQDIHKNIHKTSLEFTVHIHNIDKFNSQIVYSQHWSKIQYSQHRSSIFTLFPSTSVEITHYARTLKRRRALTKKGDARSARLRCCVTHYNVIGDTRKCTWLIS
jgi:hypothetical protein